tara:strand:- start:217 stop:459 length:243 start_codon:yes stop_codon:yes gene_type:complete
MEYEIKTFETEGDSKRVGFMVTSGGRQLAIDKLVTIVDGKTDESYVQDALAAAKSEIDEWAGAIAIVGKKWDADKNSFIE